MTWSPRMAVAVLAVAAGCTSSGERMDATRTNEIRKGVTTRSDVEA